ncbi:MAG: helix-turn-helix domain-containing protein [Treponema sp.]|jgi:transcriptional regulator with XRE-family HTH domain|nr:helix-turn-helix domain-containing protein [Treponema sp.]
MTGADLRHILSKNIKLLRKQRSLSQVELAEKADISIPFLSNIERGNKWPHPDTLTKLAEALGVEVYALFIIDCSPKEELEQLRQEIIQDIKNNYDDRLEKSFVFNIENVVKMSVKQAVASEFKNLKKNK